MANLGRALIASALLSLCAGSALALAQAPATNPDAKLLVDYQERVKKYMEVHKSAKKDAPPIKETKDAGAIKAAQDALAAKIRALRPAARQGEIFTPEIAKLFRRLMYPETTGREGAETKQTLKEDAPPPKTVPLKVNARYPDEQPLPTMPPNLLANLPKLPEELEYRIVGKDLILRDVPANLIVDFIPGAIR
jgi:hypothetical protein